MLALRFHHTHDPFFLVAVFLHVPHRLLQKFYRPHHSHHHISWTYPVDLYFFPRTAFGVQCRSGTVDYTSLRLVQLLLIVTILLPSGSLFPSLIPFRHFRSTFYALYAAMLHAPLLPTFLSVDFAKSFL